MTTKLNPTSAVACRPADRNQLVSVARMSPLAGQHRHRDGLAGPLQSDVDPRARDREPMQNHAVGEARQHRAVEMHRAAGRIELDPEARLEQAQRRRGSPRLGRTGGG